MTGVLHRPGRLVAGVPLLVLVLAGCTSTGEEPVPPDTEPSTTAVTLTVDGGERVLELTEVVCSGEPGRIVHINGSTGGEPPLVEAGPDRFVMVHLGSGEPHRSEDPSGVSYAEESVAFSDVPLSGGAQLDGTLMCTAWDD